MSDFLMKESLVETYARLKRNLQEATEAYNKNKSVNNETMLNLHRTIFNDFCVVFTEHMLEAAGKVIEATDHM